MEEKEELNRKLKLHVLYNVIGFMTIFIVFGIFVFLMVSGLTYSQAKKDLLDSKETIVSMDKEEFNFMNDPDYFIRNNEEENDAEEIIRPDNPFQDSFQDSINNLRKFDNRFFSRRIISPNVTIITRDKDGNVTNSEQLGRLEEYAENIPFSEGNIDRITEIIMENNYTYRALAFEYGDSDDDNRYVQLLVNVDSEANLVASYFKIIVSAVVLGCILSIIASYILSKKTLKPLQENMLKQMEFVQNVSHELRTPLTIIQAKQELLLQDPNAKIIDKSEDIGVTLSETKRLTKMVKDLLMLSRADSKSISLQKDVVDIDGYISEIVNPYIELAEVQEKKLNVNCSCKTEIEVDSGKIYQLIVILLDNALKYTEPGDEIEVNSYMKDNKCVIEVKDTGIGVSEEGLKRIFERFYREDKARGRETGGSGLGLSIASSIVSMHGGTIKATHNSPKGMVFTVRLPR